MTVNQRVLGSSPSSGAKALKKFSAFFVYMLSPRIFGDMENVAQRKIPVVSNIGQNNYTIPGSS